MVALAVGKAHPGQAEGTVSQTENGVTPEVLQPFSAIRITMGCYSRPDSCYQERWTATAVPAKKVKSCPLGDLCSL